MRIAFAGFRHGHILGLYQQATEHPGVEIVAACESHQPTVDKLKADGNVKITHGDLGSMLAEVSCDAVAIGDYYAARGKLAIAALKAGKHVIADKPICTSLDELSEIERLASAGKLRVGCMLDLRANGFYRAARKEIASGAIGEVHTVSFSAQHPLMPTVRPGWYFEQGLHGGTINDIAIHAIDIIPWMTGRSIDGVVAARAWNARMTSVPFFQDAAQLMLRLDNQGGVLGDVSYLAPEKCGYSVPQYWRITCHGSNGMIEATLNEVKIATNQDTELRVVKPLADEPMCIIDSFIRDIAGKSTADDLTTALVLTASRRTLEAQAAADKEKR